MNDNQEKPKGRKKKIVLKQEELVEEIVEPIEELQADTVVIEHEAEIEAETAPKKKQIGPKIKKQKVLKEQAIKEVLKQTNLPVIEVKYDEEDTLLEKAEKPKEKKLSKKELLQQSIELEKRLLEDNNASFVQVVKDKRGNETRVIRYNTDITKGLSNDVVEHRMAQGLVNERPTGSTKTIKRIIFSNLFTFFNLLTVGIAIMLLSIGSVKDMFFMVIVLLNNIIGIIQEINAKRTIDKLSIVSAPNALILRDGDEYEIPVNEIVLDDILVLTTGKQITSDAVVIEGSMEVNESLLTGESDAIQKKPGDILYSGSYVVSGRCKARVDHVGKDNYMEKLTSQAKKYKKPKSDLMNTLKWIIRTVGVIIIPLAIGVFLRMRQQGGFTYFDTVRATAGAMVGMIPSGLFLLTSVALSVGVVRISNHHTLVQDLYCIEMLARIDVLCLDKTGTITDGTMSVKSLVEYNNETGVTVKNAISAMLNALNDSNLTSVALEEKFGRGKRIKHRNIIPFNSTRKYSAVEFERYGTFLLGAPEFVLTENFHLIATDVEKFASDGYRILVVAHSFGEIVNGKVEGKIAPIALILIEDTIRPDAIETINYFKESGVEVRVISGDNPITVSKISERAGVENAQNYISLEGLTDKEVVRAAGRYTIFGRVSPSQKKLLVVTLKEMGKTVAMTGDGVNDILALREADCSIALASGSEAATNVSHLVLLDSNFSSMPRVVAEGRRVINNVQKVASLFLTKTIFSFLLAVIALFICKYPIKTSQLFMIDFFVIGIPSFFLALEPNNQKVEGKFVFNVFKNAIPGAFTVLISTLIVFAMGNKNILNMSDIEMSTLIVINATFTCFMVLLKVCRPMNLLRKILFSTMSGVAIVLTLFVPDFFEFIPLIRIARLGYTTLRVECLLLLLVLVQATYPAIHVAKSFFPWLNRIVLKVRKLLSKY